MIHQLIFAAPRPGMTEEEFQRYWLDVHAVRYASKIPQIRKYLIDTRVPLGNDQGEPLWSGVAEIWLNDEREQLASLQSEEFLQGARLDEPRWAAFWRTVVLDTDATEIVPGPPLARDDSRIKLITLVKRREGLSLAGFRARSLGAHADLVREVPGLRRYLQCHTRDGYYGVGEAVLDAAYQLYFDDLDALENALGSAAYKQATEDLLEFVEPRYVHRLVTRQHWIIGPEPR
ncbi:EthD family reductase [Streptosporangium sp. NPDC001559]|uniref:EthD domain-containing protein n=1 Tax=Streptosporangium sp. NPDC001559 TaxID=3366187 RepID=UPI0036E39299